MYRMGARLRASIESTGFRAHGGINQPLGLTVYCWRIGSINSPDLKS
jgi:hypothetical protein